MIDERPERFERTRAVARAASLAIVASLSLAGCGGSDPSGPARPVSFEVTTVRLPQLPAGKGHYEAWIAFPEPDAKRARAASDASARKVLHGELELISLGAFRVGSSGELTELDGSPAEWALRLPRNAGEAAEAWISIEPEGVQDTIPSGLLLGGEFFGSAERGVASLSLGYRAVLDTTVDVNLATLEGRYTITSLALAAGGGGAREGVEGLFWRADGSPGLNLPAIDGVKIVYESWVQMTPAEAPRSTGRFLRPDTIDVDGAGLCPTGQPETPGHCFACSGPASCFTAGDAIVLVSVEPADDNDPLAPSPFVLLRDTIPTGQPFDVPIAATNVTSELPTATIIVNR
jgi:hypothetical protein